MTDLETTWKSRRDVLGLLGGVGAALLVAGCGGGGSKSGSAEAASSTTTSTSSATTPAPVASCTRIPEETAGPFPGDGTNGPNALTQDGIVRRDIRSSVEDASDVAAGLPLTINLTIVDNDSGCRAWSGAAVYIWHCDIDGRYSMYSDGVTEKTYLRGVQEADANGRVTFTSIFPGAYSGRWPHIHFEVFPTLAEATNGSSPVVVSQLALPADVCAAAYATDGYHQSAGNIAQTSLESDNVFSDGASLQTATVTGDAANGYTADLVVSV